MLTHGIDCNHWSMITSGFKRGASGLNSGSDLRDRSRSAVDLLIANGHGLNKRPVTIDGARHRLDFALDRVNVIDTEEKLDPAVRRSNDIAYLVAICAVSAIDGQCISKLENRPKSHRRTISQPASFSKSMATCEVDLHELSALYGVYAIADLKPGPPDPGPPELGA